MTITMHNDRANAANLAAAEHMALALQPELLRLAVSILHEREEAEDAVQDAPLAVLKNLATYRGEASFKTWLFGITINVCRRSWQKQQARRRLSRALYSDETYAAL